ncbi:hypothetical protein PTE30175_05616 [Pandoraea terrae]|uniref:Uncharacterized protein n=1 Tax=Pandoraea terrae TaxID=1537710 RepID=A0A5E4ZE98_9BURK|nr:hypothetical protein PTE30175_05616 [Pandoraea terrae]
MLGSFRSGSAGAGTATVSTSPNASALPALSEMARVPATVSPSGLTVVTATSRPAMLTRWFDDTIAGRPPATSRRCATEKSCARTSRALLPRFSCQ